MTRCWYTVGSEQYDWLQSSWNHVLCRVPRRSLFDVTHIFDCRCLLSFQTSSVPRSYRGRVRRCAWRLRRLRVPWLTVCGLCCRTLSATTLQRVVATAADRFNCVVIIVVVMTTESVVIAIARSGKQTWSVSMVTRWSTEPAGAHTDCVVPAAIEMLMRWDLTFVFIRWRKQIEFRCFLADLLTYLCNAESTAVLTWRQHSLSSLHSLRYK